MPKMGESIIEATIIKWHKNVGEKVEQDEILLEIATDKVDSEIPSPVSGVISQLLYSEGQVVAIDALIAIINTGDEAADDTLTSPIKNDEIFVKEEDQPNIIDTPIVEEVPFQPTPIAPSVEKIESKSDKFYSPLVRNMAKEEKISMAELDALQGSGLGGRLTKNDVIKYISDKPTSLNPDAVVNVVSPSVQPEKTYSVNRDVDIIEMDRMRKMISDHMVMSKRVSAHVTSFVEADVTNMVRWRNKYKDLYFEKYGEKITFTPLFVEAIVQALKDFPKINCSVIDDKIHVYKNLNIGMATALPNGNLIVPVIKNADYLNLAGLTKQVNDLATRARENKLKPDEVKDGTFTFTNIGGFGNIMGTPIINQPQAAILAFGAIQKKPAVLETPEGDVIAIRQMMFMSMSYDHRIIDGYLGGSFLKRVADLIEAFDFNRPL